MKGKTRCLHCRKTFEWNRSDAQILERGTLPKFCNHKCRLDHGGTGAIVLPRNKLSDLTQKQKLDRLRKNFEDRVVRQDNCWGWKGPIDQGGYPVMGCKRECGADRGHRASYILHKGPIPKEMHVCHACDNPVCTNPNHLWLGTHKQNNDDKVRKGRGKYELPTIKIGVLNPAAKLNESQVKEIKILIANGRSCYSIGKQFFVSKQTILRIKNGKNWKHVEATHDQK